MWAAIGAILVIALFLIHYNTRVNTRFAPTGMGELSLGPAWESANPDSPLRAWANSSTDPGASSLGRVEQ